jgi:uncharacterized protein YjbJ (UPF0337 family)
VEHETKLSAMINGNQDAGMLALMAAMETATAKCKEHGFGLAGTRNTPSSTGALGYYAQKVAEQGLICVVLAQSPEFVAPHGSKQVGTMMGDAKSSLGDTTSSLGDAKSSLGDAQSSLGDAKSSLGDAKSSLGDAKNSLGDAESSLGDTESSLGDAESSLGDAKSSLGDAKSSLGDAKSSLGDAKSSRSSQRRTWAISHLGVVGLALANVQARGCAATQRVSLTPSLPHVAGDFRHQPHRCGDPHGRGKHPRGAGHGHVCVRILRPTGGAHGR